MRRGGHNAADVIVVKLSGDRMTPPLKYDVPRLGRGIKSERGGLVTATFAFSRSEEETIMRWLLGPAVRVPIKYRRMVATVNDMTEETHTTESCEPVGQS